jgi:putative addiction module killer protein
MIEVRETSEFSDWLDRLRDANAVARIQVRIRRLSLGNAGDVKAVGAGVSEMRIDYGPGYRIYYKAVDLQIVILLCGGDKRRQDEDIANALMLAKEF